MKFSDLLGAFKGAKPGSQSHVKNLLEMAVADGHFHESEKELIKNIAKQNGISDTQLAEIQSNPGKVRFEVPTDAKEKFHQLFELVQMMTIDKHVHSNEQNLAQLFAVKFGYKHSVARELVEVIRENIKNGSTADETLKRVHLLIG